ncbi:MAG: ExbD/TolR family protein [Nitrospiria bacterium]
MRRRHARNQGNASEIDMTPLIDMVFILLIFFIVTTSFVKETGIDVHRPTAKSAEKKSTGNILIAISNTGEVWLDRRQISVDAIRPNVERLHAENPEGGVVIMADKQSETGILVEVIDQARLAGVPNVSIAAQEGRK